MRRIIMMLIRSIAIVTVCFLWTPSSKSSAAPAPMWQRAAPLVSESYSMGPINVATATMNDQSTVGRLNRLERDSKAPPMRNAVRKIRRAIRSRDENLATLAKLQAQDRFDTEITFVKLLFDPDNAGKHLLDPKRFAKKAEILRKGVEAMKALRRAEDGLQSVWHATLLPRIRSQSGPRSDGTSLSVKAGVFRLNAWAEIRNTGSTVRHCTLRVTVVSPSGKTRDHFLYLPEFKSNETLFTNRMSFDTSGLSSRFDYDEQLEDKGRIRISMWSDQTTSKDVEIKPNDLSVVVRDYFRQIVGTGRSYQTAGKDAMRLRFTMVRQRKLTARQKAQLKSRRLWYAPYTSDDPMVYDIIADHRPVADSKGKQTLSGTLEISGRYPWTFQMHFTNPDARNPFQRPTGRPTRGKRTPKPASPRGFSFSRVPSNLTFTWEDGAFSSGRERYFPVAR